MGQSAASTLHENKDIYEVLQSASRDPQRKALWQIQIINNVTLDLYSALLQTARRPFTVLFTC